MTGRGTTRGTMAAGRAGPSGSRRTASAVATGGHVAHGGTGTVVWDDLHADGSVRERRLHVTRGGPTAVMETDVGMSVATLTSTVTEIVVGRARLVVGGLGPSTRVGVHASSFLRVVGGGDESGLVTVSLLNGTMGGSIRFEGPSAARLVAEDGVAALRLLSGSTVWSVMGVWVSGVDGTTAGGTTTVPRPRAATLVPPASTRRRGRRPAATRARITAAATAVRLETCT